MKILFLTSRFPYPPIRGDKLRVFNLIRELSKDHEIVLATFADPDDGRHYAELKKYVSRIEPVRFSKPRAYLNCLLHPFSQTPFQVYYYQSIEMRRAVAWLMAEEKPDVIHAHLIRMAPYALAYPGTPKVLDICDSMTLNYEHFLAYRKDLTTALYRLEKRRTATYEGTIPAEFDTSLVISSHDRDFVAGLGEPAKLVVVPNGVDFDYFQPWTGEAAPNRLAFMGTMSYFPNVDAMKWFAADILPLVRRTVKDAELHIVGNSPSSEVTKLGADAAVTVTGFVEDVRPLVGPAAVFVCPIRAATGLNNKVIEAMAMGLPVVSTPEACEGIDVTDGVDILLASNPMDFAEAVIQLMTDAAERKRIGDAGRDFVVKNFSWGKAADILRNVYAEVTK